MMARSTQDKTEPALIRTVLIHLCEAGAALRPALDERQMVLAIQRTGVTLAKKTVSRREVEKLLARGFIRRQASPSRQLVITLKGEQAVRAFEAREAQWNPECAIEEVRDAITGDVRIVNYKESPLAWLSRRKNTDGRAQIDALQFAAGERLRSDFTLAGLTPRMTLDWTRYGAGTSSGIGHPGLATEVMTAARQRLHAALDALGPELAGLALDLCCFLKGIGDVERARGLKKRTAKHRLIVALDRLVHHYGLGAEGPAHGQGILTWVEP
jgi:hypothetical protein